MGTGAGSTSSAEPARGRGQRLVSKALLQMRNSYFSSEFLPIPRYYLH